MGRPGTGLTTIGWAVAPAGNASIGAGTPTSVTTSTLTPQMPPCSPRNCKIGPSLSTSNPFPCIPEARAGMGDTGFPAIVEAAGITRNAGNATTGKVCEALGEWLNWPRGECRFSHFAAFLLLNWSLS